MSVETYARGGYTGEDTYTVRPRLNLGERIIPRRDLHSWSEMSDAERLRWIDEAKNHSHCACGNPRFHLQVTC